LAEVFVTNYERPAYDPEAIQERKDWALWWYNYLAGHAALVSPTAKYLQITELTEESVTATCYTQNVGTGMVLKPVVTKSENSAEIPAEDIICEETEGLIEFIVSGLQPNTAYTLDLLLNGTSIYNTGEEEKPKITFTTPPGRPKSVASVQFERQGLPSVDNNFVLSVTPPQDWGYWHRQNSATPRGYDVQLLVNGKVVKTINVTTPDSYNDITTTLDSDSYFNCSNLPVAGDTVQVGVRTWVKNPSLVTLYDGDAAKTSDTICLINKSHYIFVNRERNRD
jgi:hypothetical protein